MAPLSKCECVGVEPPLPGSLARVQIAFLSQHNIRARTDASPGCVHAIIDSRRKAALSHDNGGRLPSAQQVASCTVQSVEEGNVVDNSLDEPLRDVEAGQRMLIFEIVVILRTSDKRSEER